MKYLTLFVLLIAGVCAAQQQFVVKDSLTKAPVPFATVNFLNGYGLYADGNGQVTLQDAVVKQAEFSSLGYTPKKVTLANSNGVVNLVPEPISIEEVIVTANPVKPSYKVIKPKAHQNDPKMAVSRMGIKYAIYIPGGEDDSFISSLALPLMKNDFVFNTQARNTTFKEVAYKTLIKVEFLDNNNGVPGQNFSDFEQVVLVGGGKLFEVELTENVALPQNGIFVKLTFLGKADDAGNLLNELTYDVVVQPDGRQARSWKQQQPNFPLYEVKKGQVPTFTASGFDFDTAWRPIEKPLMFNPAAEYNGFAIGIGYTIATYK